MRGSGPWSDLSQGTHRCTLFCLPYAGGGASVFRGWSAALGVDVRAARLPGRELRFGEPARTDLASSVAELWAALGRLPPAYALYGHSMGALLAFQLVSRIEAAGLPRPCRLLVGACSEPRLARDPPIHELPAAEFWERVGELSGVPDEVLEQEELLRVMEPTVRADFAAVAGYVYDGGSPLQTPVVAFAGRADPTAPPAKMGGWLELGGPGSAMAVLDGDHFFLRDPGFMPLLRRHLAGCL